MNTKTKNSADSALSASPGSVSVPLKLIEELIEIACDYINPDGENHHGVPLFNHGEACRVIREAGDIRDSFCKPNAEIDERQPSSND